METSKGIEQAEVMRRWHEQQALPKSERDILEFKHFNDTTDDCLRDQLSRGQQPLVALHNAAQAYAASLKQRDCSQYADETAAWSEDRDAQAIKNLSDQIDEMTFRIDHGGMQFLVQLSDRFSKLVEKWRKPQGDETQDEPQYSEAVELLREGDKMLNGLDFTFWTRERFSWRERVRKFLEGK